MDEQETPSETPSTDREAATDPDAGGGFRFPGGRLGAALALITALALLARVAFVGVRIAHQDEARVAYWVLRYLESGQFEYRPIIHGPFKPIVTKWFFAVLGPSDFAARLPVVVVGGLAPLSAWFYREHLRSTEVVALALFLAFNPVLLYYGRFMRSDVPVAAFMLVGFGLLLRAYDTRSPRYLYPAVAFVALALTAKENALLYPVCWLGGVFLLFDQRLLSARMRGTSAFDVAKTRLWNAATGIWAWRWHVVANVFVFFAVIVFFYAPRGGGYGEPFSAGGLGLWRSVGQLLSGDPGMFVAVVDEATFGAWDAFMKQWARSPEHPYLPFLFDYLDTMRVGGLVLSVMAVVGFLADRYSPDGPRDVVQMGFYWGFFSVLGYPLVTDIQAPWATVHALAPLAIPAAAGLAMIVRWGREAFAADDQTGVTIAVVLVLLLGAQVGMANYQHVYVNPADSETNQLVQYAQSSTGSLKPMLTEEEYLPGIARENRGIDVLYYGEPFYSTNETAALTPKNGGGGWFARLPLAWYLQQHEYAWNAPGEPEFVVNSTDDPTDLERLNESELPPVIVTLADEDYYGPTKDTEADIDQYLDGYVRYEFQRYGWSSKFVIFVDEDWEATADTEKRLPPETSVDAGEVLYGTSNESDGGLALGLARDASERDRWTALPATRGAVVESAAEPTLLALRRA